MNTGRMLELVDEVDSALERLAVGIENHPYAVRAENLRLIMGSQQEYVGRVRSVIEGCRDDLLLYARAEAADLPANR